MKKIAVCILLLLFSFQYSLKAQWKRESVFSFGITNPMYPKGFDNDLKVENFMKMGIFQSWYNPDTRFSFRLEIGVNAESVSVDLSSGGLAMQVYDKGTIVSFNAEASTLFQLRMFKKTSLAVGPAAKYLIGNISHMTHIFYPSSYLPGYEPSTKRTDGFNRKYLNQPSVGVKAMLSKPILDRKINMGLIFDYQWRKSTDNIFQFAKTLEISFYLGFLKN
ncbi:MAG: hypothetical protein WC384_06155 [Prolixibacteraceae bacterium]|jgi:hypothetical protein